MQYGVGKEGKNKTCSRHVNELNERDGHKLNLKQCRNDCHKMELMGYGEICSGSSSFYNIIHPVAPNIL